MPSRIFQSTGLTPASVTRIRTSSASGSGVGTSANSSRSAPPKPLMIIAFMSHLPAFRATGCARPLAAAAAVLLFGFADALHLAQVPLVAAERRFEPRAEDLFRDGLGRGTQAEAQHVGVVPDARPLGRLGVVAQGGPDARNFVRRQCRAGPGPTHDDRLVDRTLGNPLGGRERHDRPVHLLALFRSEILDLVTSLTEILENRIDEMRSRIAAHRNLHDAIFSFRLRMLRLLDNTAGG